MDQARSPGRRPGPPGWEARSATRTARARTTHDSAAQTPRSTAPRPRHGRWGPGARPARYPSSRPVLAPHRSQPVRDLPERHVGLDAGADAGQDVLGAGRRPGQTLERLVGSSFVASGADGARTLHLAPLGLRIDALRLRSLRLTLGEGVDAH